MVSPNTVNVKKARKFQRKLKSQLPLKSIEYAALLRDDFTTNSEAEAINTEILGGELKDADVIIIVDTIDSAKTLNVLVKRIIKSGGRRVYVCASHGYYDDGNYNDIKLLIIFWLL